jgi:hypothetical protein
MKKINLIILSTFITSIMLVNLDLKDTYLYGQENVDRNIIPLLIPPYQVIGEFRSDAAMNKLNVTFVNNIP